MELTVPEANQFRAVMANFPTGVVVVTAAAGDGTPIGMVVGSFTSISLDPLLVGFFPSKGSTTYAALSGLPHFAINVLTADQEHLCRAFAARSADKFAGVGWLPGPNGAPLIDGALAWIACDVERTVDLGDHHLVVGRPTYLEVGAPGLPLLFFQGAYGKFSAHPISRAFPGEPWSVVRRVAESRACIEGLAQETRRDVSVVVASRTDLWVAASSSGATSVTDGARIPLIAPVASVLVAPEDVDQVSAWLEPYEVSNEDRRREAAIRLQRAHERGYSVALEEPGPARELHAGWASYSSDLRTPNEERSYRRLYDAMVHLYDPSDEELVGPVRLRSLTVPIGSLASENVGLRISGFEGDVDAARLPALAERMKQVAHEIGARSGIGLPG